MPGVSVTLIILSMHLFLHLYRKMGLIGVISMAHSFVKKLPPNKKGEVRYLARIKHESRFIRSKTFQRKRDAAEWAAGYVSNLENFRTGGKQPCEITFEKLAGDYLRAWKGTDSIRGYSVSTFARHFGKKNIALITTDDCRKALAVWENNKSSTYNKHHAVLSAIFDFAIAKEEETGNTYIQTNPVKRVRKKSLDNLRVRYLSDEEKKRLIASCRQIGGRFYLAFLLGLSTGLRKSNVLNLRWSDVDFERALLIIGKSKNGEPITQPVPAAVMNTLRQHRKVGKGLIFDSDVKPGVPNEYKKQWIKARENAGISDFRWHDLRHDVASTLARDGRSLIEIAHALGHKSIQSTTRYAHLSTQHTARLLNESIGSALEGVV